MSDKRTCTDCQHWKLDGGWAGTEETIGETFDTRCGKGYWVCDPMYYTREQFRKDIATAQKCPDFDEQP